ncbi:MAG: hypothetical protein QOF89_3286 [Acidobacteriota bacterium]|jgi:hypothetical protein|nr:hypothetical protein [Acidobacteriota bacterium]
MLKNKLATVLVVLTFALLLVPAASQAAPLRLSQSEAVTSVFDQLVQWWDLLAGRAGAHTPSRSGADLPKNGCGIDPNGAPCPGPGPQATTPPPDGGGDPGL